MTAKMILNIYRKVIVKMNVPKNMLIHLLKMSVVKHVHIISILKSKIQLIKNNVLTMGKNVQLINLLKYKPSNLVLMVENIVFRIVVM